MLPVTEPTDVEIDLALHERVYGYRWFDVGRCGEARQFLFAHPTSVSAGVTQLDGPPQLRHRAGLLFDEANQVAAVGHHAFTRFTLDTGRAHHLLRYVCKERGLWYAELGNEDAGADAPQTERHVIRFYRLGSTDLVCERRDRTFERAVTRGVLDLLGRLDGGGAGPSLA